MSVEPAGEVPVEPGDRPPHLNRWVTGAALAALVALAVVVFWPSRSLDTLDRPEESLERVVARDMDFRYAARATPAWERRLHVLAFSSDAAARADAIVWYEELAQVEGSSLAELYRIMLLAEDGQTEAVQSALAAWMPGDDEGARRLATWAGAAYGTDTPPPEELRAALDAVRRELPRGWFADRLATRLASRLGDAAAEVGSARAHRRAGHAHAVAAPRHPGRRGAARGGGARSARLWLAGRRARAARVAAAPLPPTWTVGTGPGCSCEAR